MSTSWGLGSELVFGTARSPLLVHRRCWGCWQSQRSGHTGWARGGSARQPHTTSRKRRARAASIAASPACCARFVLLARQLCVSSAFPLAWPESLNGLFRTPLSSPAPPPFFVRWLARVSAGGLRWAKSGGAGRSARSGCYLLHFCRKLSGCESGKPGRNKIWCFLFPAESGELDSLARILPAERIPQLQEGPFQELPGGAAWLRSPGGSAPAAGASSVFVRDSERSASGTARGARRLRPEGTQVGE